jgi:hypothetical protein
MEDDGETDGHGDGQLHEHTVKLSTEIAAKWEPDDDKLLSPKLEPHDEVLPDESEDDDLLDVEAQLLSTRKGKGRVDRDIVEIVDISDNSDDGQLLKLKQELSDDTLLDGSHTRKGKGRVDGRMVEIIELSD